MEFLTDEQSGWPGGRICHLGNNQVNGALGLDLTKYGAFIWGQWTPYCPFWTLKFTQVVSQRQTEAWLRYCLLTPFLLSSSSPQNPFSPPFYTPQPFRFPLLFKSHAPFAMPSILIHFFLLIFSSTGKCFGGWQPNLSTDPMFLNSPSLPSGCCPCIAAQVENKEGRWGWTRPNKVRESSRHEEWGYGHSKGLMVLTVVERRAFCLQERSCSWPSQPRDLTFTGWQFTS